MSLIFNLREIDGKKVIHIKSDHDYEQVKISFYFSGDEMNKFFKENNIYTYNDCMYNISQMFDCFFFYYMEFPNKEFGNTEVRFRRFNIPLFARKIIFRYLQYAFSKCPEPEKSWQNKEVEIEVTDKMLDRWNKLYSQGSGKAIVIPNEYCLEDYYACLQHKDFVDNIERLKLIAKNSTNRPWQTAYVYLYRDSKYSFTFRVPGLFGGLIFRGDVDDISEKFAWSIHT